MSLDTRKKQAGSFSYGEFVWWFGVVEDRMDPKELGRVRVRVLGYHTADLGKIPKDKLFWAIPVLPITGASISGYGWSPTGMFEGTHVFGFFVDGHDGQMPMVVGTILGIPKDKKAWPSDGEGFNDPNEKYPEYPLGEIDTNRTCTNRKISETHVQKRRDLEDKNVESAFGVTWSEKTTPYAAKYPYNHVRHTESGHVEEFDDTEGKERYLLWHRTKTFREIHDDGSTVHKIVKDSYEIVMGDDYVHIMGNCTVTIDGDSHLRVKGNANIEIDGNCREHIHGNYKLNVDGNYDVQINGHHYSNSDTHTKFTAPRIDLNP